jgi:hypothetical protein
VDWAMKNKGLSQRRACDLAGIDPRINRYRSRRPDDEVIRGRLRELASERRRFGYRRLISCSSVMASTSTGRSSTGYTGRSDSLCASGAAASVLWAPDRR